MGEKPVGGFEVEIELANTEDMCLAQHGRVEPANVRRLSLRAVVYTGEPRFVIPAEAAKKLGVRERGKVKVLHTDGRTSLLPEAEGVHLKLLARHGVFNATVNPERVTAVVGRIVLDDLDLLVDCTKRSLCPRDPHYVISEAE
jgi:hypothetical protein